MESLKVNTCCIALLEQVLTILKKHVSNGENGNNGSNDFKPESQLRTLVSQLGSFPAHKRTVNHNNNNNHHPHHHHQHGQVFQKPQSLQVNKSKENHSSSLSLSSSIEGQVMFISKQNGNKDSLFIKSLPLPTPPPPPPPSTVAAAAAVSSTPAIHAAVQSKPRRLTSVPLQVLAKSAFSAAKVVKKPPSPHQSSASSVKGAGLTSSASSSTSSSSSSSRPSVQDPVPLTQDSNSHPKAVINNNVLEISGMNNQNFPLKPPMVTNSISQSLTRPAETRSPKEVELISGLGVKMPEDELTRIQFNATTANDPAILVIALLQHFFSDEVLATSTATSCRGKGRAKHSTSQPLNQTVMEAIRRFSVLYSRKINRSLTETQVNRITANKIGTAKMALKRRCEEKSLLTRGPRFSKMMRQSSESINSNEITVPTEEELNFVIKVEKDNEF
ncbi:uncharacterized protein LOC115220572 [Argonauta hians]